MDISIGAMDQVSFRRQFQEAIFISQRKGSFPLPTVANRFLTDFYSIYTHNGNSLFSAPDFFKYWKYNLLPITTLPRLLSYRTLATQNLIIPVPATPWWSYYTSDQNRLGMCTIVNKFAMESSDCLVGILVR
jgi:hypothetical protein